MISVVTLTHNNENSIARFISNCKFADEIIVLDRYSTDATISIAKSKNITVFEGDYSNFNSIKPFIITQAKNSWILFLKPNETVSEALVLEILEQISNDSYGSLNLKSQLFFMGKTLKHSGSSIFLSNRLFKRNTKAHYSKTLTHHLIEDYNSFDSFNASLTTQAKADATILIEKNLRPNLYHFLLKPLYGLINHYIFKLGFLDGKEGFIFAYLKAFTVFKKYLYVWLKYRNLN